MHSRLIFAALGVAVLAAPASAQNQNRGRANRSQMLFAEMDTNHDGRITRAEWRGSDRSFRANDWNNDGVLSGDEVRIDTQPIGTAGYAFDDWTARGFAALDRNRDGRLTREEWQFDNGSFRRADHNSDGVVSRAEFLSEGTEAVATSGRDPFAALDTNGDGRIARGEWLASRQSFDNLDTNRDGYLSRAEARGLSSTVDQFSAMDRNHDGTIRIDEWSGSRQAWDERDTNRDGRLTRDEFNGRPTSSSLDTRSTAYRAGFERGQSDGRQAGREDRHNPVGYDLDGQRELEQADAGYVSSLGSRTDYQAGYRVGFRQAYPEGFRQGQ